MAFNLIKNDVSTNVYYVNRNDSIDRYLNSIRKYKPLTFEQENECITRYKVDGDLKARDMLVNSQQLQIYSQANFPTIQMLFLNSSMRETSDLWRRSIVSTSLRVADCLHLQHTTSIRQ